MGQQIKTAQPKTLQKKSWKKSLIIIGLPLLMIGGIIVYLSGVGLGPILPRVPLPDADIRRANIIEISTDDGESYQSDTGGSLWRGSKINIDIPRIGLRAGTSANIYMYDGHGGAIFLSRVMIGQQRERTFTAEVTLPRSVPISLLSPYTVEVFVLTDSSEVINYYRSINLK